MWSSAPLKSVQRVYWKAWALRPFRSVSVSEMYEGFLFCFVCSVLFLNLTLELCSVTHYVMEVSACFCLFEYTPRP